MDWSENFFILLIHYCIESFREYMFLRILFISHIITEKLNSYVGRACWPTYQMMNGREHFFIFKCFSSAWWRKYTNFWIYKLYIFSGSDNCSRGILCIDFRGASDRNSCLWYVHNEITSQRLKKLQRHFKLGTVHEFKAVLR